MKSRHALSAIVPTLDEEGQIESCLRSLREEGVDELIVVDGGSRDRTVEIAEGLAERVIVVPRGLFGQLNRGAYEARGDVLLFHYADSELHAGAVDALRSCLADEGTVGGAFRLLFKSDLRFYRLVEWGVRWRNRVGLGPFGDQSLFLRADVFRDLGGFRNERLFADHELACAARARGSFRLLRTPVSTSVRRWEGKGRLRTLLAHWKLSTCYLLGARTPCTRVREQVEALREVR